MATLNDVVLIYLEDSPVSFARVEDISPDHKKDWYQIKLLMLQIPLQVVTWILKDDYINGAEFTMGGKKMRLETVECPKDDPMHQWDEDMDETAASGEEEEKVPADQGNETGKVISFSDLKKKKDGPGA